LAAVFGQSGAKNSKNSNFGQKINLSEKSEKIIENQKFQYESTLQIWANSGKIWTLKVIFYVKLVKFWPKFKLLRKSIFFTENQIQQYESTVEI
jgi:hypothetical protein